ncbi:CU044_2847 family protein [Streptomyces sp. NPDC001744]|uniref:CU044_2847 family protein n=1 Tax=Streptomyces sp. NPDC001744 TaxID=3364606 RepID=UPI0036C9DBD1
MAHGIARIRLEDGTPVWARVRDAEELGRGGGFQDTGVRDRVVSMAGGLTDIVRGVVGSLRAGLEPRGPVEVAVSFGIELSAQSGKVIGVLADGSGTASVNVSLTWTEPGPGAAPGAAPENAPETGTRPAATGTGAAPARRTPDAPPAPPVPPAPRTPPAVPPPRTPDAEDTSPDSAPRARPAADGPA